MASTLTTWDAFLKERYIQEKVENLTYTDRPFFAKCPKDPTCSGDQFVEAVIYGNPQGLGATLAKAQAIGSLTGDGANVIGKKFTVTYGDYAGSVEIGDKVLKASRDNAGSLLENKTAEIDQLYEGTADVMAAYLFGDSGHSIGVISTISTGLITLTNPDDVVNFFIGQALVVSANDGTSSGHTLVGGTGYVIAVSHEAGTVTVSTSFGGAAATPASWAASQFLFRDGDFGGSGATPIFTGLGGWVPPSAPSSTAFYGVDRSGAPTLLGGVRLAAADITGLNIEQRLKRLVTRMVGRVGGPGPSDVYMNPEKWQDLANALETRGVRPLEDDSTRFGFLKLIMSAAGKTVNLYADRFCPIATAFGVRNANVKLRSYYDVPHVLKEDGLQMLRKATANNYEYRLVAYPAFSSNAPGWLGRVPMP